MDKSILTIFTSPKPFVNPHITIIQRNAIHSWVELGNEVKVVLFGNESGVAEIANEFGVFYIPDVKLNNSGTPLLSDMFDRVREINEGPILAFVNADILLEKDFLDTAKKINSQIEKYLVVGQRWDLDVIDPIDFGSGWQTRLDQLCKKNGKMHKPTGSDYFIFPRSCFQKIPEFAIGRAGWDNWMLYEARQRGWRLIDATSSIRIIHQNHDYSHLPGGQPHYHLPETDENVRRAGGKRHIFMLQDVNWIFTEKQYRRPNLNWKRIWREVEIFPLVTLHSEWLGNLFYTIFHPIKAYNEFRRAHQQSGIQE
jgi:hypothetical protein